MDEKEQERIFKFLKGALDAFAQKVVEEVSETGRFLPISFFINSEKFQWVGVISISSFGREAHQRNLNFGVTTGHSAKQTLNIMKIGTKAEILEYLYDENTVNEMYETCCNLYNEATKNED